MMFYLAENTNAYETYLHPLVFSYCRIIDCCLFNKRNEL